MSQARPPVVCRVGDVLRCGRVVTVECDVEPTAIAEAVRQKRDSDDRIAVTASDPTPVHDHVGCLRAGMGLRTQTALARAARTLGVETPHDEELERARQSLADLAVTGEHATERAQGRREVAQTAAETEQLREQVAAARGRLQARREHGLDPGPAAEELADAIARLSERETTGAATRQHLADARERARDHRDRRDERLRLEDRVANLERSVRAHLVDQVRDSFTDALGAVPGHETRKEPLDADPVPAGLAVARLADLAAPVVLCCDRFDSPAAAANWLDAPVIAVRGYK
jgi:hypothetical protein